MPINTPGCYLCCWPRSYRWRVLRTPSLGLITLLVRHACLSSWWLMKLSMFSYVCCSVGYSLFQRSADRTLYAFFGGIICFFSYCSVEVLSIWWVQVSCWTYRWHASSPALQLPFHSLNGAWWIDVLNLKALLFKVTFERFVYSLCNTCNCEVISPGKITKSVLNVCLLPAPLQPILLGVGHKHPKLEFAEVVSGYRVFHK